MKKTILMVAVIAAMMLVFVGQIAFGQDVTFNLNAGDTTQFESTGFINLCWESGEMDVVINDVSFQKISEVLPVSILYLEGDVSISTFGTGNLTVFLSDYPSPECVVIEQIVPPSEDVQIIENVDNCFVIASDVNLRTAPSLDADTILVIRGNGAQQVLAFTVDGNWINIHTVDGFEGWVNRFVVTTLGNCAFTNVATTNNEPQTTEEIVSTSTPTRSVVIVTQTNGQNNNTEIQTATITSTVAQQSNQQPVQQSPKYTPTASQTTIPQQQNEQQPTATFTNTATAVIPTATFTPSYTPTQPATATFTPSYTPTTQPAAQVAPEDARFNNPLNLQLDTTGSVTDFVSYPGGDTEDRVRWDILGMNNNSALSGGRARLTLAVSCFGTGIENIQFFTGGQTYSCGQTIFDQEVTVNSKTGSVVITAVGGQGTYVQWVLTGTAVRVN